MPFLPLAIKGFVVKLNSKKRSMIISPRKIYFLKLTNSTKPPLLVFHGRFGDCYHAWSLCVLSKFIIWKIHMAGTQSHVPVKGCCFVKVLRNFVIQRINFRFLLKFISIKSVLPTKFYFATFEWPKSEFCQRYSWVRRNCRQRTKFALGFWREAIILHSCNC